MDLSKGNKSKPPKKELNKQEHLSTKEIEDLMGINQSTYKRVHGAVRRK